MILIEVELDGDALVEAKVAKGSMDNDNDLKKARAEAFNMLAHGFAITKDEVIEIYPKESIKKIRLRPKE